MNVPAKGGGGMEGPPPPNLYRSLRFHPLIDILLVTDVERLGNTRTRRRYSPPVLDGYNCPTGPDGFPDFRGALSAFRHVAFDSQCWNRIFDGCPGLNQMPEVTRFQTGQRGAVNFEPFCTILEAAYHVYFLDLCGLLGELQRDFSGLVAKLQSWERLVQPGYVAPITLAFLQALRGNAAKLAAEYNRALQQSAPYPTANADHWSSRRPLNQGPHSMYWLYEGGAVPLFDPSVDPVDPAWERGLAQM
ncbi:hypothetical protein PG990_001036 [Apiospora arundinis]